MEDVTLTIENDANAKEEKDIENSVMREMEEKMKKYEEMTDKFFAIMERTVTAAEKQAEAMEKVGAQLEKMNEIILRQEQALAAAAK